MDEPIYHAKPSSRIAASQKDKGIAKGNIMNTTEFFDALRERKWMLYVPERIYRAHRDGLLRGWGTSWKIRQDKLFALLEEQKVDLRIPFPKPSETDFQKKWIVEQYSERIMLYEESDECPPFPEAVVTSDTFWDLFLERFALRGTVTNRILATDGWVYRVRFFTLWASIQKVGSDQMMYNLPAAERREIRNANRVLRKDYGITFGDYCNTRRVTLVVLKKAYPPEQVRRVRRQLENKLRKNPAEVIRYALERELVK